MDQFPTEVFTPQGWQPRGVPSGGLVFASVSGTIDALGNVTINHKTPNVQDVTANVGLNTLTIDFAGPFDGDAIYFAEAIVVLLGTGGALFLPVGQTALQTVFAGVYPGAGPWTFSIIAIGNA